MGRFVRDQPYCINFEETVPQKIISKRSKSDRPPL